VTIRTLLARHAELPDAAICTTVYNHSEDDSLVSAGLGLRYVHEPVSTSLDYGRLLNGSRVSPGVNSAAPQKGDDRVYVNLLLRF
jgi:hypothetical protein